MDEYSVSPNSIEAERAVLGGILLRYGEEDIIEQVFLKVKNRDYFYLHKHRIIYDAILVLRSKGGAIDITTIPNELRKVGKLGSVVSRVFLVGLIEEIVSVANILHHADIIVDKYILRHVINVNYQIIESCYRESSTTDEILDTAETAIMSVSADRSGGNSFDSIGNSADRVIENVDSTLRGERTFVISGLDDLDNVLHGFADSNLYIIAGRPGMGKTALAMNIAEYVGKDKTVGVMSMEMDKDQLAERLVFSHADVLMEKSKPSFENGKMIPPSLTEQDNRKLMEARDYIKTLKIEIDDTPALDIRTLRAKAKQLKAKCGIELLIVDYIQLMAGVGNNRTEAVGEISRGLKILAKELHIPVIALSQLSRALETRTDKRPMLSDLRDSGAIEQDADAVIFTYREEMYLQNLDKENPKRKLVDGKGELIIGKNRHGKTGTVHVAWIGNRTRFENPSFREDDYK